MELNLSRQTVSINEVIYDGVAEQAIECDVMLPDYCPDIQRILHCEAIPTLISSAVNGDRLNIEGMAIIHFYYQSEDGCIRKAEYKVPYSKTIELRATPVNPSVSVEQSMDYFNCRAVSQRRMDMRGAVKIVIKVSAQSEEQVVSNASGAGIQLCREQIENTHVLPQAQRPLTVREEVELGYGKPAIGSVIRCAASAQVNDYKVLSGKLVAKGELLLKVLYQCEDNPHRLEAMEYSLPLSQIIDMDGVDEDCTCSVWYDVCNVEVVPRLNADGESKLLGVDALLNANAKGHRQVTLDTCTDSYSTAFESKQVLKQVPLLRLVDVISENSMYKETLDLPPNVNSIIDIWCTPANVSVTLDSDAATVSGKLNICMFVSEEDGEIAYYDQLRDFTRKIPIRATAGKPVFSPLVRADSATFSMGGHEKIEVRCIVHVQGCLYSQGQKKVVSDISIDEEHPKAREENTLYLYYANAQEPIWEIAKRYNTSVDAIQQGNALESRVLADNKMLLIPMK